MKNLIIILLYFLFLLNGFSAFSQSKIVKLDTIYYFLDTAAVPKKDRFFKFESESHYKVYFLQCKCYPYGKDIPFFYDADNPNIKKISIANFEKIKTVSITELINIVLSSLPQPAWTKYVFVFIEPDGTNMKLTYLGLASPYDPRKVY
ncbi:hypothetical protein ACVWYG_002899 [Pedobacter sp. UYEF25]